MCGIVGYVGGRAAAPVLLEGLARLEYRGYDSADMAAIDDAGGDLTVVKVKGKVAELEARLEAEPLEGTAAIGHTRWATHGVPSAANAHPHADCTGRLAVVHNGIVENYRELKAALASRGHEFRSETDTEVLAHLLEEIIAAAPAGPAGTDELVAAVREMMGKVDGAIAMVVISAGAPGVLVGARRASPLAIGVGKGETLIASDAIALVPHTREVLYLGDDEVVRVEAGSYSISTVHGEPVERAPETVTWDVVDIGKDGFAHFMLKEIFEQPASVRDTLRGRVDAERGEVDLGELGLAPELIRRIMRVVVLGMGTSWHAGLIGRNMIERTARIPVQVDYAAEFRYRDPVVDEETLVLGISQSGETADTLAGLKLAKEMGVPTAAIVNVVDSSIAREVDAVLYTRAGPEIGVASTKAFTAQIAAIYALAIHLGRVKGALDDDEARRRCLGLSRAPAEIERVLESAPAIEAAAGRHAGADNFLFLGRGTGYPLALEGALKLKEISYVHAEGYHAAEMKHGPIALIDEKMPVLVLALQGRRYEKIMSNIQEVRSRGARVLAVASLGDEEISDHADDVFYIPDDIGIMNSVVAAVPLQLFAYYVAVARGCDVDRPRNLAKSVTVE